MGITLWLSLPVFVAPSFPAAAAEPRTELVSTTAGGTVGNDESYAYDISQNGRYVAFSSVASDLVAGDSNIIWDVFVRDRQAGTTTRISVNSTGTAGNDDSSAPSISADGRYVAFTSSASNLVEGDLNAKQDIFIHDRQTGATTLVSVKSDGTKGNGDCESPSISADGRYVVFESSATNLVDGDTNSANDVFIHDRQTSTTARISVNYSTEQGNDESGDPKINDSGRYIIFTSAASNLVAGDTNGYDDVFVHDRETRKTSLVNVDSQGHQGNEDSDWQAISGDGKYVIFDTLASNFTSGDSNGMWDVYVRGPLTAFPWAMFLPATTGNHP